MSDSLALNKVMAAVLVCGIAYQVTGLIATGLVHAAKPVKTAIKIDVQAAPVVVAGSADAPLPPVAALLAKADLGAGQQEVQKVCSVCHSFEQGAPAKIGPNLYGIVGAAHAHMVGFNYSDGLKAIKGPWTYAELNQWLSNPRSVVPGTRMSFAGIDSSQQRADVIDYLHTLAASPEPLPAPNDGALTPAPAAATPAVGKVPPAATTTQTPPTPKP